MKMRCSGYKRCRAMSCYHRDEHDYDVGYNCSLGCDKTGGVAGAKCSPLKIKEARKPAPNNASPKCPHCGKKIFIVVSTSGIA